MWILGLKGLMDLEYVKSYVNDELVLLLLL